MSEEKEDPILPAPEQSDNEKVPTTIEHEQRRRTLLEDPNYGVILCFLEKFRSHVDAEEYPLHLFEENLLSDEENVHRRLIDFHLTLLKKISLGKGAKREKFLSIISKFAFRFDFSDGEILQSHGYSHAQIDLKLRILKNLLELQFDHNQSLKSSLVEKQSFDIRSGPFGRDRSGASYWLFQDSECFIRLFREEPNEDRSWKNIANDKDELEKIIQLLITDHLVRKKYSEWKFSYESFNALIPSTEFEEKYFPPIIKQEEILPAVLIKEENSAEINNNQEEKKREKTSRRKKSKQRTKKKRRKLSNPPTTIVESTPATVVKSSPVVKSSSPIIKTPPIVKSSSPTIKTPPIIKPSSPIVEPTEQKVQEEKEIEEENLPIALRRSRRIRKTTVIPPPPPPPPVVVPSPKKSVKKVPTKQRRRRRNGKNSSSSEENCPTEDEDEYNSDDYLPEKNQSNELDEEDLREEEDEDDEYVPRRSAKTVAKRHGQLTNVDLISSSSSSCGVCSKSDRPESLLLCDDCDDAYHLECLRPILLSVPDGNWFCPLCEHKKLAENLIEKFLQLIKDLQELEIKRNQCISKRTNRLANVMSNLDRMVQRSTKQRKNNGIVSSDEGSFEESSEEEIHPTEKKNSPRRVQRVVEELGVRSCRRKPQNYRFDDYDKKLKEAMIEAGENLDEIDEDSNESNDEETKKSHGKRAGYDKDEDFDLSKSKNDEEFAPDADRSDESDSEENEEDEESSDDGWKTKRRTQSKRRTSSRIVRRKVQIESEDDDESFSESELNQIENDVRRSNRTVRSRIDVKNDDEEESEEEFSPPAKRRQYKRRAESDESFVDDDDDYEKIARKRDSVKSSKTISRSTIPDHIEKLVQNETTEKNSSKNFHQIDDDEDFPSEEEILRNFKENLNGEGNSHSIIGSSHSYQHAIIDPTARFALIRPAVRTNLNNGCHENSSNH